ncbi:MAG: Rieske 2Fe-2S domain-containing protein [Acidobacteriota bacterium]
MSVAYRAVQWNRQKRLYDLVIVAGCLLYLGVFIAVTAGASPAPTAETLILRAFGSLALVLLHVVLSIGPLARLDRRFAPLLYNRRHLGVTMFLAGLIHGVFALLQFHSFGTLHPLASALAGETPAGGLGAPLAQLPFQPFGLLALTILFLMAATSHDFWLANLTAPVWKALHMLVYVAYAAVLLHVVLGILQVEQHPLYVALLTAGAVWVVGLHLLAGWRERAIDRRTAALEEQAGDDGFVEVCTAGDIPERRALTVTLAGDRVAIFRDGDAIYALSSVCKHQNGPLGEGKIVDGCVVCPWHGYQYLPQSGTSPPPFHETVPTFRVRTTGQRVFVHPTPLPPGTETPTARVDALPDHADPETFYIGWEPRAAAPSARRARQATVALMVLALAVGGSLAAAQGAFAPSFFDFGAPRVYEGIVQLDPHPRLLVPRDTPGGVADAAAPYSSWLLSGAFKHGAEADVGDLDGRRVRLEGTPVYRGRRTLLEVVAGSVEELEPAGDAAPVLRSHGRHTLRGEIVDSKCHLGVMKPGEGKAHRACATLCIRGGIPPLLVVADGVLADRALADGAERLPPGAEHLLFVGAEGEAVGLQIMPWVAEPIEVTGEVIRVGDSWVFEADLTTLRRVS